MTGWLTEAVITDYTSSLINAESEIRLDAQICAVVKGMTQLMQANIVYVCSLCLCWGIQGYTDASSCFDDPSVWA